MWLCGLGNKTKKMFYSSLSLKMLSFVLFPQDSQPCMNFNITELVYRGTISFQSHQQLTYEERFVFSQYSDRFPFSGTKVSLLSENFSE